ncbi:MAG: dTDP-4-dehydrorhamnose 3,5-epimerase [Phycisphaerae bacterium]
MQITPAAIPDVKLITPRRFEDPRGFFSETFSRPAFEQAGLTLDFVQDNHSYSAPRGVVRGLHYQIQPFAQDKLVRVVRGSIFDVAVDLRKGSATFGKHVSATLSAAEWNQILVPIGFAHGFCTLEPDTEVIYKVTGPYSKAHERGIAWNDADLGIAWPIASAGALLSDKDRANPSFADVTDWFD